LGETRLLPPALPGDVLRSRPIGLAVPAALVLLALGLTLLSPLAVLLVAPLLLGVPHIVGDLRCLVVRPPAPLGSLGRAAILLPLLLLTLLKLLALGGAPSFPRAEIGCGLLALLGGVSAARPGRGVAVALVAAVVALAVPLLVWARWTQIVLAHLHNLIAFAWWYAAGPKGPARRLALAAYASAIVALLLVVPPMGEEASLAGLGSEALAAQLAPGLAQPWAQRLVVAFAFAQLFHYAVWAWLLPRERGTTLRADLGDAGLWSLAAACLLVPLVALWDPLGTRGAYLQLAAFHAWLELAVLAFLLTLGLGGWTRRSAG
jgi:hypothetical protein